MQHRISVAIPALAGWLWLSVPAGAQVAAAPQVINFQGKLSTPAGTAVPNGNAYTVTVSLWDAATGGTQKWSQTLANVTVQGGVFSALLTTSTPGLFNGTNLWLQTQVGGDAAMTPRIQVASVPFAIKANTVPDASIASAQLASDAASVNKTSGGALALSGGKLGVGTSTPGMSLEVTAPSYYGAPALGVSNGTKYLYLHGGTPDPSLIWNSGSDLRFGTETSRGVGYAELMRVASSGNVGIGTSAPGYKLDVIGGSGVLRLTDGTRSLVTYLGAVAGTDGAFFGTSTNHPLIFQTNNTTYGIITTAGQWGIGTLAPTSKLGFGNFDERKITYFENAPSGYFGVDLLQGNLKQWVGVGGAFSVGHQAADGSYTERMRVNGNGSVGIGTVNPQTLLDVNGEITGKVVNVTGGSDVAEPYDVAPAGGVKPVPGMVVCIDGENVGRMKVADAAYSRTVAGIISGANGIAPGITLRQKGTVADGALPIASMGRVWAMCDADANGSIEPGDLLTSSDTPGYAMKATDHARRDGAVIGKAMSSLKTGKGLALVLVSLK